MKFSVGDKVRLIKTGTTLGGELEDYTRYLIKGKIYRVVGIRDSSIMVSLSTYWMHENHFELYIKTRLNIIEFVELFLGDKLTSYQQEVLIALWERKPVDMRKIKNAKQLSHYFTKYFDYAKKED